MPISFSLSLCLYPVQGGDFSGASQPLKHVQFLPIDGDDGPPIDLLARKAKLESPGLTCGFDYTVQAANISRAR